MPEKIIEFPGKYRGDDGGENERDEGEKVKQEHLDERRLTEMLEFLTALRRNDPGSFNPRNVDIRSGLLESAPDQELFQIISQSGEAEWKAHPSYYDAVIRQLKNRGLIPDIPRQQ